MNQPSTPTSMGTEATGVGKALTKRKTMARFAGMRPMVHAPRSSGAISGDADP